jgi:hypothetical protein
VLPSQIEQRHFKRSSQVLGAQFSSQQAIDFGQRLRSCEAVPADQRGSDQRRSRVTQRVPDARECDRYFPNPPGPTR